MKETIKIIILEIDHWSGCNHFTGRCILRTARGLPKMLIINGCLLVTSIIVS